MINITLPDRSQKKYNKPLTGLDIAKSISQSLTKEAIAIKANDNIQDLNQKISSDCTIKIITKKSPEALEIVRHDAAHIMAEAVQYHFPIKDGFYYDFDREQSFTPEDFIKIEKKMNQIIKENKPFIRQVLTKKQAIKIFTEKKEIFKVELIKDLDQNQELTIYKQGKWFDLCKGPHSPSTGFVGNSFKLLKLSGAYWRGDSRNKMLQRIY